MLSLSVPFRISISQLALIFSSFVFDFDYPLDSLAFKPALYHFDRTFFTFGFRLSSY